MPLNNPAYINGLEVNGYIYNNVLKVDKDQILGAKNFLYYSKSEGIILVNFENGQTLSKIK
jgi:hypothetical protein